MHRAVRDILVVGLAGETASHDALEVQHRRASDHHRAPVKFGLVEESQDRSVDHSRIATHQRARHVGGDLVDPEIGQPREHAALLGDRLVHHDVKGTQTIRGDHQHQLVVDLEEVANLARVQVVQVRQAHELHVSDERTRRRCVSKRSRSKARAICSSLSSTSSSPSMTSRKFRR